MLVGGGGGEGCFDGWGVLLVGGDEGCLMWSVWDCDSFYLRDGGTIAVDDEREHCL